MRWIGTTLLELEKSLVEIKAEDKLKYHRYKAEFSVLKALYYLEVDKIQDALDSYRDALTQYKECGPKEQIVKITEQIQRWKTIQDSQESARLRLQQELASLTIREKKQKAEEERLNKLNIDAQKRIDDLTIRSLQLKNDETRFLNRQTELKTDIAEKEAKNKHLQEILQPLDQKRRELDDITGKLHEVEKSLNLLESERTSLVQTVQKLAKSKEDLEQQTQQQGVLNSRLSDENTSKQNFIDQLEIKINRQKLIVDFFSQLQSAATAPLWIEVLKLAIKQGTMDELTKSAAQRLLLTFPEQNETEAILMEIIARTPDKNALEVDAFLSRSRHWMAKIAQAERIKDKDPKKAAQLLIEAWETFLKIDATLIET